MRLWLCVLLLCLVPVLAPAVSAQDEGAPSQTEAEPLAMKGMVLPFHSEDPDYDYRDSLDALPTLGVSHVAIFVHFFQDHGRSEAPYRHPIRTPTDRNVLRTIERARELGMQVVLLPILLLENPGSDDWRGNLRPPDWDAWFAGYQREILHFARLAQRGGASAFVVGSELSSTERQGALWRATIRRVRSVFRGELIYAANWDHYQSVPFWTEVDAIGLSAYYELTDTKAPEQDELTAAWGEVRDRLLRWRARNGYSQRFVLMEVGYASQDGCAWHPWDYTQRTPVDTDEQRMCYEAFVRTWQGVPELQGVFFYEWWGEGGPDDRGYTPRGKPAAEVMRRYFGATPR